MPLHPFQNNKGYAGAHGDSYNSGTIPAAGPLGRNLRVTAFCSEQKPAYCSTQHFDAKGPVINVCVGRKTPSRLVLLDPDTMHVLAEYEEAAKQSFGSGSGTTPVLFGKHLIAFGDNADPRPNVLVYSLDDVPNDQRLVCKVPVFKPGRSVLENSFIGYDHSLVIENNKGFKMDGSSAGAEPGFARIDVRADLSGCDIVWENYEVRAGTGAKLSLGNGLIYVHELLMGTDDKTVWRHFLGYGEGWDNALLTMSISPDGVLTSGMYAGILAAKDLE